MGCAGGHGREGERRAETITVDRRNEMAYPPLSKPPVAREHPVVCPMGDSLTIWGRAVGRRAV
jgi:hypothetical protein